MAIAVMIGALLFILVAPTKFVINFQVEGSAKFYIGLSALVANVIVVAVLSACSRWAVAAGAPRRMPDAGARIDRAVADHRVSVMARPAPPTSREPAGRYHDAMPKLLLNLRGIPDDEVEDVRALLDAKRIPYRETRPSPWGISAGGIWVVENADFAAAKLAFDDYERDRSAKVRAEYAAAKRAGTAETLASVLRDDPLRVAMILLGILFVLGLATVPFFLL